MSEQLIIERVENTVNVLKPNDTRIVEICEGLPGKGIPALGSEGQVLKKASDTDYDTVWDGLTASEIELEAISGISGTNVQEAVNELAINELRVVAPIKNTGSGNNTDTNTLSLDMETVDVEANLQLTDKLLIQRGTLVKSVTYDQLGFKGDQYLRGTVDLVNNGNSGTVVGDPLNASISEGVAPTVNQGDPLVGVHYIVENTTVTSSITGELLSYVKGDYVEWSGASWLRIIRTLDDYVESFNGRTRVVTPQAGDYTADQVTNAADLIDENIFEENITMNKALEVLGTALFNSTGGLRLPVGNTLERPVTATVGYFRFNTDIGNIEVYDGSIWVLLDSESLVDAIQQLSNDLDTVEARVTVNEGAITALGVDISNNATAIAINAGDGDTVNLTAQTTIINVDSTAGDITFAIGTHQYDGQRIIVNNIGTANNAYMTESTGGHPKQATVPAGQSSSCDVVNSKLTMGDFSFIYKINDGLTLGGTWGQVAGRRDTNVTIKDNIFYLSLALGAGSDGIMVSFSDFTPEESMVFYGATASASVAVIINTNGDINISGYTSGNVYLSTSWVVGQ